MPCIVPARAAVFRRSGAMCHLSAMRRHLTIALLGGAFGALCLLGGMAAARTPKGGGENPYPGYTSTIYSDPSHWLCRPDTDDVCDHDLDATIIKANGHTQIQRWHAARHPKFDCFYVYPTISTDPGGNSDLVPGANQELFVVVQQAARLGLACRVFAPVYRQVTLTAPSPSSAATRSPSTGSSPMPTPSTRGSTTSRTTTTAAASSSSATRRAPASSRGS